jgi:septal ring factor EnvC (AmiA/AmiB activator)
MPIFGNVREVRIKPWEDMTQREKIENLHHEIIKIDNTLTTYGERLDDLTTYIKDMERQQEKIMLILNDLMQKEEKTGL